MTRPMIAFAVHGLPAPQGSKRHVGNGVMVESSKRVKPWREAVKWAALEALKTAEPLAAKVAAEVEVTFYLPRPKSHFRTGANAHMLRGPAPEHPATKPDIDKLVRSTLDALQDAGCYADDSQVIIVAASKFYAHPPGFPVGATVRIREVP